MTRSTSSEAYALMCQRLIALRTAARMTQKDLAGLLGKQQAFVSNIETGARRIDVIEFFVIVRALGRDPEEIFFEVARSLPHDITI